MSETLTMANSSLLMDAAKNSREARAKRLKRVRKLTLMSRKDFAIKYQISQGTLQNWETARFGGLTEKGARFVIESLKKENIHCTFNWLMYGAGIGPQKAIITSVADLSEQSDSQQLPKVSNYSTKDAANIEMKLLEQNNPNILTLQITNNSMLPEYNAGQIVAGHIVPNELIENILGEVCIVQTENHGLILRRVQKGSEENCFNLLADNTKIELTMPVIYNAKIIAAAPVSWIRRQDS